MNALRLGIVASVAAGIFCASAWAAPSLLITKPPVQSGANPNTGPDNDPLAAAGQWFIPRTAPLPAPGNRIGSTVRTHEFHDNVLGVGGGVSSFRAIQSGAVSIYDTNSNAMPDTFNIDATITNDLPGNGPIAPGTNSHGETRTGGEPYDGWMLDVKLTASFAVDIQNGFPQGVTQQPPNPPYVPPGAIVYQATNHDELAWYCFSKTPDGQANDPFGNFWVPTWDFGDIKPGASATQTLTFFVGDIPALQPGGALASWLNNVAVDKFWNRSDSLKISDWVSSNFGPGPGMDYDGETQINSNVSVFHNVPEPGTLSLFAAGTLWLLRRRRN